MGSGGEDQPTSASASVLAKSTAPRGSVVGLLIGGAALAVAASIGPSPGPGVGLVGRLAVAAWLLGATAIAVVDLREHRIPNRFVGGLSAATLVGLIVAAIETEGGAGRFGRVLLGAIALAAVLFGISLVSGGALGMGDVKLSVPTALLVMWFGAETAWLALVGTVLSAAAVVVGRAAFGRPQTALPLAPFIVVGVGVALLTHR